MEGLSDAITRTFNVTPRETHDSNKHGCLHPTLPLVPSIRHLAGYHPLIMHHTSSFDIAVGRFQITLPPPPNYWSTIASATDVTVAGVNESRKERKRVYTSASSLLSISRPDDPAKLSLARYHASDSPARVTHHILGLPKDLEATLG
ncbi:hypothetical protein V5O48_007525 [Marasmius crinis-equi]|uniref:Uncharacterized protein n=1 Tax=Marasmius crinis-equi TaxID=585013 RepID=A0ABR3FGM3_9AGAR